MRLFKEGQTIINLSVQKVQLFGFSSVLFENVTVFWFLHLHVMKLHLQILIILLFSFVSELTGYSLYLFGEWVLHSMAAQTVSHLQFLQFNVHVVPAALNSVCCTLCMPKELLTCVSKELFPCRWQHVLYAVYVAET